ncbi:MAG: hypothetical protein WAU65_03165 [Candidatus Nanoarchaeia archaeon]
MKREVRKNSLGKNSGNYLISKGSGSFFIISLLIFLVVYSTYILFFKPNVSSYSDVIVATTFFFTLFSGFFITRQNDRYTSISDEIANTDGLLILLYRVAYTAAPKCGDKIREILREHYQKILDSGNWAYHLMNPSTTIMKIFDVYANATGKDAERLEKFDDAYGSAFSDLQVSRKRMVLLAEERLLPLQWALVLILGALMVIAFNFIPNYSIGIDILKIFFGVAVFFVILLLKQLDDLSIFGKDFNKRTAKDNLRIITPEDIWNE